MTSTRNKRVTIKQVAAHAGLSTATVSVVLNHSPVSESIRPATKERVLAAARELNYRPNYLARSLRGKRSFSIGILVPEVSEGYAAGLMSGIEAHLIAEGYFYLMASHRSKPELLAEYMAQLEDRSVEGFLLIAAQLERPPNLPTVVISEHMDMPGIARVGLNHDRAARLALEHLLELDHREIAFFRGAEGNVDAEQRWQAIVRTADSLDLKIRPELVQQLAGSSYGPVFAPDEGYQEGYAFAQKLLAVDSPHGRPRFTALFGFNDVSAIGAIRAFLDAGLAVPDDISVIGFDDTLNSAYQNPRLTTVRQPLRAMGEAASSLLLQQISSPDAGRDILTFDPELIIRASTAPAHEP